jgi:putative SOS response-associated peptidase YedK
MPAIISEGEIDRWLDLECSDLGALQKMLVPLSAKELTGYPVSMRVNDPRNDGPLCVEQLAGG